MLVLRARLAARSGAYRRTMAAAGEALAAIDEGGDPVLRSDIALDLGTAAWAMGDVAVAESAARRRNADRSGLG